MLTDEEIKIICSVFFDNVDRISKKIWNSGHKEHELLIGTADQSELNDFIGGMYIGPFCEIPIKADDDIRSSIMTKEGDKVYL